jgi:hypothetical protein
MSAQSAVSAFTLVLYALVVLAAIGTIRSGVRRRRAGRAVAARQAAASARVATRRCRCGYCRTESPLAPWRRRAWALVLPGPGRAARIRYGLGRAEYAERVRFEMPMRHPDWLTGVLSDQFEERLAELEAATWEDR